MNNVMIENTTEDDIAKVISSKSNSNALRVDDNSQNQSGTTQEEKLVEEESKVELFKKERPTEILV